MARGQSGAVAAIRESSVTGAVGNSYRVNAPANPTWSQSPASTLPTRFHRTFIRAARASEPPRPFACQCRSCCRSWYIDHRAQKVRCRLPLDSDAGKPIKFAVYVCGPARSLRDTSAARHLDPQPPLACGVLDLAGLKLDTKVGCSNGVAERRHVGFNFNQGRLNSVRQFSKVFRRRMQLVGHWTHAFTIAREGAAYERLGSANWLRFA
jgi:hypothetical protein